MASVETSGSGDAQPTKEQKLTDDCESMNEKSNQIDSFHNFEIVKCLNDKPREKVTVVHGRFAGSDDDAVVLLEKEAFTDDAVRSILTGKSTLKNTLQNNIYGTFELEPPIAQNKIKTTVIYPATQQHIIKWTAQETFLVKETAADYRDITLPYLQQSAFKIEWVYNILEKKKEADRIVYEDADPETGFILLPDMKWNQNQIDDLYLVAIIHKHAIKSIRELDESHLPLLKNILVNGQDAIKKKYGLPAHKLRIYFHYQPSYYHLHVHFTHIKFQAAGSEVERAHLLQDVIDNIEVQSDYYSRKTLMCMLRRNDSLFSKFVEAGRVEDT